jgi:uroporphyrinogen III methyltransferase/synthase
MKGKVYLVGAGPGDPGLLTLKGCELIQKADVILYDALVSPRLLRFARPKTKCIFVGKRGGQPSVAQDEIEKTLIQKAREGKIVVRLKGGDPFIFGRGGEEALLLAQAGIDWEVVPGVTSAIAAPAYAGIPLTQREFTSTVAFITGHEDLERKASRVDWTKISTGAGTLVFLMGISNLTSIIEELMRHGRSADTPCAVVMWGTLPKQKTVTGRLSDIVQKVEDAKLSSPSVFVVGEVVRLREQLNWFEKGPLFGKKVLVTRAREQASVLLEALEKLGADAVEFPTIQVVPPEDWRLVDAAIQKISKFHWIIFTSVNGVKIFLERLRTHDKDVRDLKGLKIAAIGEITRRELEDRMLHVDLSPSEFVSEALLEEFKKLEELKGQKFLLPRAEQARSILSDGLKALGAEVTEVALYRTLPDPLSENRTHVNEIFDHGLDWVTFTSSSTVKNFVTGLGNLFEKVKGTFKVASIGPITSGTIREAGLVVDLEAKRHTIDGLVEEMIRYYA